MGFFFLFRRGIVGWERGLYTLLWEVTGLKNSEKIAEMVNAAQPHDFSAVALPPRLLASQTGAASAGGFPWGLVWWPRDLLPALGCKINDKDLGIRGLCGITVFLLSFQTNLCTFKLVKLDLIFAGAFFRTPLWSFASSNIMYLQLPPSAIWI